jgi:hypothetical protein
VTKRSMPFDGIAHELVACAVADLHDPAAVGAALDAMCVRLEVAMAAMVGTAGFRALLERALHLTRKQGPDPELPLALGRSGSGESWIGAVERIGKANAVTCAGLLFVNVFTLLASFIGEDLTFRLIRRTFRDVRDAGSEGGQKQ